MARKVFVINTGSTTTKIALYVDSKEVYDADVDHDSAILAQLDSDEEKLNFRKECIDHQLEADGISLEGLDAIACRGGTISSVEGGAYLVEENMIYACDHPVHNHASVLSAKLGKLYGDAIGCNAYIYDAVGTDEVDEIARYSGHKLLPRTVLSHTLNTRAVCHAKADELGKKYNELNFIVAHMGGGLSVNAHRKGRIVDIVSDDDGPMSPERAGKINTKGLVDLCFSGKYTKKEVQKMMKGQGGIFSYLGTTNMREVRERIANGDKEAEFIQSVMGYQVSKEIGLLAAALGGEVDQIILTGGAAHGKQMCDEITERVKWIAPVTVYPGAMEMQALNDGICRVLDGEEEAKIMPRIDA